MPTATHSRTLTPELRTRLAQLWDQPDGIAEVALSALPYGSRTSLVQHGIIRAIPTRGDAAAEIVITKHGWEVIREYAEAGSRQDDEHQRARAEAELRQAHEEWVSRDKSRVAGGYAPGRGSTEVPSELHRNGLADRLAWLADQPPGVAEVSLSAMSYESRALLIDLGVIEPVPTSVVDEDEPEEPSDYIVEVVITPYGAELIAACAAQRRDQEQDERERQESEARLSQARERYRADRSS